MNNLDKALDRAQIHATESTWWMYVHALFHAKKITFAQARQMLHGL